MLAISLLHRIRKDARKIGLPIDDVDIVVYKRYCSTYYGRYYSTLITKGRPRIKIYPYANKKKDMYSYDVIFSIVIHEMVHHLQFVSDEDVCFAHDQHFWDRYNKYIAESKKLRLIRHDFEGLR